MRSGDEGEAKAVPYLRYNAGSSLLHCIMILILRPDEADW